MKALLVGADVVMMASALIGRGPEHLAAVQAGVADWMEEHGYEGVDQRRGTVSHLRADDPSAFERALYEETLLPRRSQLGDSRAEARGAVQRS